MLSDLYIPSRINQHWKYSGIDTREKCLNVEVFDQYPYEIDYQYNTRGLRDREWPETDLDRAVWCIGDSFTVGIGTPREHTWVYQLEQQLNRRCINVSLDGSSNDWIARRLSQILHQVQPQTVVVMWSYINRREAEITEIVNEKWKQFFDSIKDSSWPDCTTFDSAADLPKAITEEIITQHLTEHPFITVDNDNQILPKPIDDEERRLHFVTMDDDQDVENFRKSIEPFYSNAHTQIIHSVVPGWAPDSRIDQCKEILQQSDHWIPPFERLDLARDGHHFDIETSRWLCQQISDRLDQ